MKQSLLTLNIFLILILTCFCTHRELFDSITIYQIQVATFANGDPSIGYKESWGPSLSGADSQKTDFGGDLQGIIDKIPYIAEMGFNAIWITPIFDQGVDDSNITGCIKHGSTGYFAKDYFNVDPHFGSKPTFKKLVEEAHKYNLYFFLDGPFGHWTSLGCGVEITESPKHLKPIPYPTDFTRESCGSHLNSSCDQIADFSKKDTVDFFVEVTKYWIEEFLIDGWRLDRINELRVGNENYADEIRKAIDEATEANEAKGKKWGILGYALGEHFEGNINNMLAQDYGTEGSGLFSYFDFPCYYTLLRGFADQWNPAYHWVGNMIGNDGDNRGCVNYFKDVYPKWTHPNVFIGNHDVVRFGNILRKKYNIDQNDDKYWSIYIAATAFQVTFSSPITIYYGEEIGEITHCYYKRFDCDADDDNSSRTNLTPEDKLTDKQKAHKKIVTRLIKYRVSHPSMYTDDFEYVVIEKGYDGKNYVAFNKIYHGTNDNNTIVSYLYNDDKSNWEVDTSQVVQRNDEELIDLISETEYEANVAKIIIPPQTAVLLVRNYKKEPAPVPSSSDESSSSEEPSQSQELVPVAEADSDKKWFIINGLLALGAFVVLFFLWRCYSHTRLVNSAKQYTQVPAKIETSSSKIN